MGGKAEEVWALRRLRQRIVYQGLGDKHFDRCCVDGEVSYYVLLGERKTGSRDCVFPCNYCRAEKRLTWFSMYRDVCENNKNHER